MSPWSRNRGRRKTPGVRFAAKTCNQSLCSSLKTPRPGILPCQSIEAHPGGAITSDTPFDADQVQPASLDLRLSDQAWRVRASFLPGLRKVEDRIAESQCIPIDLSGGFVLEKGCVYIARLQERLTLPKGLIARANPQELDRPGRCVGAGVDRLRGPVRLCGRGL